MIISLTEKQQKYVDKIRNDLDRTAWYSSPTGYKCEYNAETAFHVTEEMAHDIHPDMPQLLDYLTKLPYNSVRARGYIASQSLKLWNSPGAFTVKSNNKKPMQVIAVTKIEKHQPNLKMVVVTAKVVTEMIDHGKLRIPYKTDSITRSWGYDFLNTYVPGCIDRLHIAEQLGLPNWEVTDFVFNQHTAQRSSKSEQVGLPDMTAKAP